MSKTTDIQARIAALFAPAAPDDSASSPHDGRIAIWHDPEGQFEAELSNLGLPEGVRLLIEEPDHLFELKCAINSFMDVTASEGEGAETGLGILLYRRRPARLPLEEVDWLADVECYAKSFQADWASLMLAELKALDTPEMRASVARHRAFLRKKSNVKALVKATSSVQGAPYIARSTSLLRPTSGSDASPNDDRPLFMEPRKLDLAVMALVLSKEISPRVEDVLVTYLTRAFREGPEGIGRMHGDLTAAGSDGDFAALLREVFGFGDGESLPSEPTRLIRHILFTAASASLPSGELASYAALISTRHIDRCQCVLQTWASAAGASKDDLLEMCRETEVSCDLGTMFARLSAAQAAYVSVFPAAQECAVGLLCDQARTGSFDLGVLAEVKRAGEGSLWSQLFKPCREALDCYAELLCARRDISEALAKHPDAVGLWAEYTGLPIVSSGKTLPTSAADRAEASSTGEIRLCSADTAYRRLHLVAREILLDPPSSVAADAIKELLDAAESVYTRDCLRPLCDAWSAAIEHDVAVQGYVDSVARQEHFFMNEVSGSGGTRTYVIISDALRFEVACELTDRLAAELKGTCELSAAQSVFPSVTRCGMAALLPHGALRLVSPDDGENQVNPSVPHEGAGHLSVMADGLPTQTTAQRQAILRRQDENSIAVRYAEFNGMSTSERRALVADAKIVYLYHNAIDATGDKPDTESQTFEACARAIDELSALVKSIVGIGGSRVIITADHGFLYTAEALAPTDMADRSEVEGVHVEDGRRFVVAREGAHSECLLRVGLGRIGGAELVGFTPRDTTRIAVTGGGARFVHGGLSLQEMCVPVIRFAGRGKASVASHPARFEAVSTQDSFTSLLLTFVLLQSEPVGGKVTAADYEMFVADEAGAAVTQVLVVSANSTSSEPPERTRRVDLSLRPGIEISSGSQYHLTALNRGDGSIQRLASFAINLSFGTEDFGW